MSANADIRREGGFSTDEEEPEAKRRRLRKGTHSCWECKRRKVRCVYRSEGDITCGPCLRRGTNCVSQELPEKAPEEGNGQLHERLGRVELLLNHLVETVGSGPDQNVRLSSGRTLLGATTPVSDIEPNQSRALRESLMEHVEPPNIDRLASSIRTADSQETIFPKSSTNHETLSRALLTAWPSQKDIDILCELNHQTEIYFHLVNTKPLSELEHDGFACVGKFNVIPTPDIHPVLLARRMLVMALFLQNLPPNHIDTMSEQPRTIMKRVADTAISLVTTTDELLGPAESLECIVLEAVYQSNAGNLRRAWLAFRRAMLVGQMMKLSSNPSLKTLGSSVNINPQFLWFRIVYMDRFLSLMLGFPQGTSDRSIASVEALKNDTPTGRLQRIHAVVAARILERNERDHLHDELAETQDIDTQLLRVAESMPDKFWLPPSFIGLEQNTQEAFHETMRLVDQIYHYSLLSLLHLPYACEGPVYKPKRKSDYSQMTCVNASREILTRFVAFRSFNRVASCCRPADFSALLAAMMLILAHLNCHRQPHADNFLAHQRPGDRAMMEQVLENMELVAKLNEDALAEKSAKLLQRLLIIEANAAQGINYSTENVQESGDDQENVDHVLHMSIPYLGTIRIAREGISCEEVHEVHTSRMHNSKGHDTMDSISVGCTFSVGSVPQPLNQSGFSYLQPLSAEQQSQTLPGTLGWMPQVVQPQAARALETMQLLHEYPNLAAGVDEWAFQGVDTAFFGSLMRDWDGDTGEP